MLTADTVHAREPSVSLRQVFVLALLTATLIFVLHHLPPLSGHAILASAGVFAGAALVAALAGGILARGRSDSPIVVITAPGESEVRQMQEDDLDFCAELHAQALGHGFFVSLGPGFMRAYYRNFLESPHAMALTSVVKGHPVGLLVGVLQPQAHARWVLRHRGAGLALRGAAALTVRPRVAAHFVKSRLRRYASAWRRHKRPASKQASNSQSGSAPAVLSHMAVVPGARGAGAGRELVRSFEATSRGAGARWAILTTLAGPEGAGPFYARLGWTRHGATSNLSGVPMEQWTRTFEGGPACAPS